MRALLALTLLAAGTGAALALPPLYGALALIGRGDLAGARAKLERVLALRMVEFHEYQMATGLLPRLREAAAPSPRP